MATQSNSLVVETNQKQKQNNNNISSPELNRTFYAYGLLLIFYSTIESRLIQIMNQHVNLITMVILSVIVNE